MSDAGGDPGTHAGAVLDAIRARRSVSRLVEPAPAAEHLQAILEAAACAPDHGCLRPWRFVVLKGDAKDAFGEVLAEAYERRCRARDEVPAAAEVARERTKLSRAPLVVVVGAVRRPSPKIPWEEQCAAAAAAIENALLAATALGYGTMWRTGDPAYDPYVKQAIGLSNDDAIVGFLYIGTVPEGAHKPPRSPDLAGLVAHWQP